MPASQPERQPVVLITGTMCWPFPARVAMAFAELGWRVEALCTRKDPMKFTRAVRGIHHYAALRPLSSLSRAIARAAPDLVVPCDDRAVLHVQALRARAAAAGDAECAAIIARSLGDPLTHAARRGRAALIALARRNGVRAPLTLAVNDRSELRRALDEVGLPAMMKVDDTWGSEGVILAETAAQAERGFAKQSRQLSSVTALKRLVVDRDPFWLLPWLKHGRPRVNVQALVPGQPANCLVACWQGEVLANIQVEVLRTQHDMGPAAVVRVVDRPEMEEAARTIVGELRLSGFCGLDFMVEEGTGAFHLIEMNQRMTPVGHLALGAGRDPVAALAARVSGRGPVARPAVTRSDIIAYFPQAWLLDPGNPDLRMGYHDVPWSEPDLVRELSLPAWRQRGWLARMAKWVRSRRAGAAARPAARAASGHPLGA